MCVTARSARTPDAPAQTRYRCPPRSFALNILRAHGVTNVSEALYTNALSLDHLLNYGALKS